MRIRAPSEILPGFQVLQEIAHGIFNIQYCNLVRHTEVCLTKLQYCTRPFVKCALLSYTSLLSYSTGTRPFVSLTKGRDLLQLVLGALSYFGCHDSDCTIPLYTVLYTNLSQVDGQW